jgi:hypothetical protein
MLFDHYAVSRDALLNKSGDVSEDGKYVTPYSDPNKRFGMCSFCVQKVVSCMTWCTD